MEAEYRIVCVDRTRASGLLVFWKPNRCGYTTDFNKAGLYTESEAIRICRPQADVREHIAYKDGEEIQGVMVVVDRDRSGFFKRLATDPNPTE